MNDNYVNKKELRELIILCQKYADDIDPVWLEKYNKYPKKKLNPKERRFWQKNRDDYVNYKKKWYEDKIVRLSTETDDETLKRRAKYKICSNKLVEEFYKIVDGVMTFYTFRNAGVKETTREEMRQNAVFNMFNYVNKFDSRRPNPFSFFTEIAKNACLQTKVADITFDTRFVSIDFITDLEQDIGLGEF